MNGTNCAWSVVSGFLAMADELLVNCPMSPIILLQFVFFISFLNSVDNVLFFWLISLCLWSARGLSFLDIQVNVSFWCWSELASILACSSFSKRKNTCSYWWTYSPFAGIQKGMMNKMQIVDICHHLSTTC